MVNNALNYRSVLMENGHLILDAALQHSYSQGRSHPAAARCSAAPRAGRAAQPGAACPWQPPASGSAGT